mgnify:CR=1 FL=1
MRAFEFVEPATLAEVIQLLHGGDGQARPIAGGSDVLGELKDDVVQYTRLVSLGGLTGLGELREVPGGLRLGALMTLAQLEYEPRLQGPYRLLAEAARGVSTPEIRQQGTLGGNLCQRPRCLYYRSALSPCLKKGGTDCPAVASPYQDYLSIMGGQGCFSVHASDLAPPLLALSRGSQGPAPLRLKRFLPVRNRMSGVKMCWRLQTLSPRSCSPARRHPGVAPLSRPASARRGIFLW